MTLSARAKADEKGACDSTSVPQVGQVNARKRYRARSYQK